MKLPAFQFYPGDWQKDPGLRRCSHAAKGAWIDILCLMFESEERGVLISQGHAWSDDDIALAIGGDLTATKQLIYELTLKGVANRDARGALTCRRMVRDEHKRKLCTEAGKKGGNPKLVYKTELTLNGQTKGRVNGRPKRNPTPSSSSSSSDNNTPVVPNGDVEALYELYPRKKDRNDAIKAIQKALKKDSFETIKAGLLAYKFSSDSQFIPLPATWFNKERWKGETVNPNPNSILQPPPPPEHHSEVEYKKLLGNH